MKRTLKISVAIFLVISVCFSFSACNFIDSQRELQVFEKDGKLICNGQTYVELPAEAIAELNVDIRDFVFITDDDVPLLMMYFYGNAAFTDKDRKIIAQLGDDSESVYCREDLYQTILDGAENAVYDKYVVDLFFEDEELEIPGNFSLTESQIEAIESTVKNSSPLDIDPYELSAETYLTVYKMTEDELFSLYVCDIYATATSYYIIDVDGTVYPVSEEYETEISSITAKYDSFYEQYFDAFWDADVMF